MKLLTVRDILAWAEDIRENVDTGRKLTEAMSLTPGQASNFEAVCALELVRAEWLDGLVLARLEQEDEKSNDPAA